MQCHSLTVFQEEIALFVLFALTLRIVAAHLSRSANLRHSSFSSTGTALSESQLFPISPRGTRVKPPCAAILVPIKKVDDVGHEERYSREVVPTALKAPIRGPEHKRRNSGLRQGQRDSRIGSG